MTKVKVIQIGFDNFSRDIMRCIYDHGGEIVGAIDVNSKYIGSDIGAFMGISSKQIIIESIESLEKVIKINKPDIAIIETRKSLNDIRKILRILVNNKINVITDCQEAFFAEMNNRKVFDEINTLAKVNGITVIGSGYQDVFCGNLISVLGGSLNKISKIKGYISFNIEDFGVELINDYGIGLTNEEFMCQIYNKNIISDYERIDNINKGTFFSTYIWNIAFWLADKFGFKIESIKQECSPIITNSNINSEILNLNVKSNRVIGMISKVNALTIQGINIEIECMGKIYEKGDINKNEWNLFGEPNINIVTVNPSIKELICANLVNRIPDVINSKPGFISTSYLPPAHYLKENLDFYINKKGVV
jgi:2,4-diaminopentanoate dehydrogenase